MLARGLMRCRRAFACWFAAWLTLALVTMCAGAQAQTVDVFGQPVAASGAAAAAAAASAPASVATPPAWWIRDMPDFVRTGVGAWLRVQADWNARIEGFLAQWPHGASLAAWATLIAVSFGYGVLHAFGPGHGKVVVGTWLASRRARVADAVLLGSWTAIVQALSAIGLVLGAAGFAHAGLMSVMPRAASMETISYLLLCVTSAWAIRSRRARDQCCEEPPVVRFPRAAEEASGGRPAQGAYLRERLASASQAAGGKTNSAFRATADVRSTPKAPARSRLRQIGPLGLAAGVRPCIGAIFALVTSMAVGALVAGVVATFAMAAGVATTVVLTGLGSIGANRTLARLALRLRLRPARVGRIVSIGAIVVILLISALQLALLLGGVTTASLS
ncbi:nickel/cobalt transporter [Paraburkholderia sp. B3]|uniref:nickel/cobalt transporter n=1 Tax=Paraburkholderia sp. B3 TaxID=3134791 RepID=UPI0039826C46